MEITTNLSFTPEMMAQQFWSWNSEEQCNFFEEISKEIGDQAFQAGLQWWYLEQELRNNQVARDVLMDMAAPLFWQTMKYMEK